MRDRWLSLALIAVAAAFPWIATALDQTFYLGLVRRAMIFAIAATSLNFILGFGGMASLGHAAFFGIGAYVVAIAISEGIASAWIAWPLAAAMAGLAALVIGAVSLRTRGVYLIMITLAFAQMVYYVAVGLKAYGGEDGMTVPSRSTFGVGLDLGNELLFYFVVLGVLVGVICALDRVLASRFGRALIGIRENEDRMEALGYPTFRFKLVAFVIAGAIAGVAGALFANHNGFVSPAALHWTQSATLMVMVIIGGIGYRLGGVFGAITLLIVEEWLSSLTTFWHLPLGLILIGIAFWVPRGLASLGRATTRRRAHGG